jgi:cholesterol transport system auxiliary component
MRRTPAIRLALAGVLIFAVALAGCVSLLPKQKPVQMYRFEAALPTSPPAAPIPGQPFALRLAPLSFELAAGSDRILTVNGDRTAYIAGARWVSTADSLFDDALSRAFEAHAGPARLLERGEAAPADYVLKLDVRAFEVHYDRPNPSSPKVRVEVFAALDQRGAATLGATRLFTAEAPAGSNTVHDIATAFGAAVGKVLGDIVAWTDAKGQS